MKVQHQLDLVLELLTMEKGIQKIAAGIVHLAMLRQGSGKSAMRQ